MSSDLVSELKKVAEKPQDASDIKTLEDGKAELERMKNLFEKFAPASGEKRNAAFVFVKPHANNDKVKALVKKMLQDKGLTIESEGAIGSQDIADKKLIDNHYYAIASKATLLKPKDMPVPADKFKDTFGVEWSAALEKGNVYNAMDAAAYLELDAVGLEKEWRKCKPAGKVVKFGGGFYCAMIDTVEGKDPIYLFNGFFMSMRQKYVSGPGIYYFAVSWSAKDLKWCDFRGKLLGPTNPEDAPKDSVRGTILTQWKELGLASAPNTGDNGVHASASPFEGLAERMNWLQVNPEKDSFGALLLGAGMSKETLTEWSRDPQIKLSASEMGSVFDALEDTDVDDCLKKLIAFNGLIQADDTPSEAKEEE